MCNLFMGTICDFGAKFADPLGICIFKVSRTLMILENPSRKNGTFHCSLVVGTGRLPKIVLARIWVPVIKIILAYQFHHFLTSVSSNVKETETLSTIV